MLKKTMTMMNGLFLSLLLTQSGIVCAENLTLTKERGTTSKVEHSNRAEYKVATNLLDELKLASHSPEEAEQKLVNYQQKISTLNVAEQYLMLLMQAKIKQHNSQHQQAIDLLEQAKVLSEDISKKQLSQPIFADLYLALAKSLAAMNDFERAYQAKKRYIEKFNDYSDEKRDKTIDLLTEKYEIAHKVEANELLDNESRLNALQLDEVKKHQVNQQRNFILIFCSILIFALLFLRQFKVRKKLLFLSNTDSLTSLLNRSALFSHGQDLVKQTVEQQTDLSILLFDIDHFKHVNDEYGHQIGDSVLVEVTKLVNEAMRARDTFGRLGGEEFVILLPDTNVDKAKAIAVRVTEKVAQHSFNHLGVTSPITLSIGVANIKDTTAVFEDILHAADLAMYQAKQRGRNQMVNYATIAEDQERRIN
jgi:diguanylate cyclase (GGDEF)-like protein